MEVHFYGDFRQVVGQKILPYEIDPGVTLLELLLSLSGPYPALRDALLDEHGRLYPNLPIFLNGRNPRLLPEGLRTPLRTTDVLSIFTPFTSGKINVEDVNTLLSDDAPLERKL